MFEEEFNEAMNSIDDLRRTLKSNKQKELAVSAIRRLDELRAIYDDFASEPRSAADFMDWTAAREAIERCQYGLANEDLLTIGMSLTAAQAQGTRMAGVELATAAIQSELEKGSNRFMNRFKAILNDRMDEDSAELSRAEMLLADFRNVIGAIDISTGNLAKVQPSKEVTLAIKDAKKASTKRELQSWQTRKMKAIAEQLCTESAELIPEAEPQPDIDRAIETICGNHVNSVSGNWNAGTPFIHAICNFAFGMALEFSDRAELDEDPQRTLPITVASAASSLISHGVIKEAVYHYLSRFFDELFDARLTKFDGESSAWIQAGATSIDRLWRNDSNQLVEDFNETALLFASHRR